MLNQDETKILKIPESKWHPSMRGAFGGYLHNLMIDNKNIFVITGDLGWGLFDKIKDHFPKRFYNVGASEQAMLDIAVGLAMEGKIPVVYSITPFLLYRPFETWRTYINHEKLHVIGIGSGRDDDYKHDGFSHYAGDDFSFMAPLENIIKWWPVDADEMKHALDQAIEGKRPYYINLKR